MSEANRIAQALMARGAALRNRHIKAQESWLGESVSSATAAVRLEFATAGGEIEAYAERVARERAEPLLHSIDTLRATNDMLRAQLAAAQAKGADK